MRRFGTGTGFACAKLSEVLPRSERSLAAVRMTDFLDAEIWNRYRLRLREAVRGPSAQRAFARCGQDDGFFGCGDLEPVPASLARSCPRSFRAASVRSLRSG